ncbi:cyclin-L1-1-like [Nicotiana sylvestris]|uniref:Cyclin-L1-1 n=1 Tax=Nicotiana sylvestris TaxID=4096 RepID=A0A1U7V596_NICSY|nr:PREDICTED: cyclin-L1-1-like [Nicotiana sylvestris]
MIYTAIMDTFYLTDEQIKNSPSRKDGIDEVTETTLRIHGCDLIQESGILLNLPQVVMSTGQVLFHRFYCKKSFARFNAKRVAASWFWLASKFEELPVKASEGLNVFHRMECRRENLPLEHLDTSSKKYDDMKADLIRTERHILIELGFIGHVEHPHKLLSIYRATLELTPETELVQRAWNLANDSLRTTLCVRFKSEVVACGAVYVAARRCRVSLPENPPWWKVFDVDKAGIDEVCRVLAHLYSLPKAQYIPVCKEGGSIVTLNRSQEVAKEAILKAALDKLKDSKTSNEESKEEHAETDHRTDAGAEKNKVRDRNRERQRDKERLKFRERDRGREFDRKREREDIERDTDKSTKRSHRSRLKRERSLRETKISLFFKGEGLP